MRYASICRDCWGWFEHDVVIEPDDVLCDDCSRPRVISSFGAWLLSVLLPSAAVADPL